MKEIMKDQTISFIAPGKFSEQMTENNFGTSQIDFLLGKHFITSTNTCHSFLYSPSIRT